MMTQSDQSNHRLFMTLLTTGAFYADPVRSFVQFLGGAGGPFRVTGLPSNLYTTSEALTKDLQPILAAPLFGEDAGDGHTPVRIAITPVRAGGQGWSALLSVELGGRGVAERLLSEAAGVAWLKQILAVSGRMTGAEATMVSWEIAPNQTCRLQQTAGARLHWTTLPLFVWATASGLDESCRSLPDVGQVERQEDGAWLLTSRQWEENVAMDAGTNRETPVPVVVWTDEAQTHFFLVPSGLEPPRGELSLRTLTGERRRVDAAWAAAHQIEAEAARALLQAQMTRALEQAGSAFAQLASFAALPGQRLPPPEAAAQEPATTGEASPQFLNALAALLNVTPEDLSKGGAATRQGLFDLLGGLKEAVEDAAAEDPARQEAARVRLRALEETLSAAGVESGGALEEALGEAPEKLRAWLAGPQVQSYVDHLIQELHALAGRLDEDERRVGTGQGSRRLGLLLREWFDADRTPTEAQRRQEYARDAEAALARAREQYPMPSLRFEDLLHGPNVAAPPDDEAASG